MIFTTSDEKTQPASNPPLSNSVDSKHEAHGNPPPYTPSAGEPSSSSMSSTSTHVQPRLPERPVTNFTTIINDNNSIKESFVIDPTLPMPRELVADTKKNLHVMSKNGHVTADIWLVKSGEERGSEPNHAVLDCQSKNGAVAVNLTSLTDCTYDLNVYSKNGHVTVAIPPDFVGPITIVAHNGSVKLSERVKERTTTFSDVNKKRTCFMGDFKALGYSVKKEWKGSSIEIGSNSGHIKLSFVDENFAENIKGFWNKLLNELNK